MVYQLNYMNLPMLKLAMTSQPPLYRPCKAWKSCRIFEQQFTNDHLDQLATHQNPLTVAKLCYLPQRFTPRITQQVGYLACSLCSAPMNHPGCRVENRPPRLDQASLLTFRSFRAHHFSNGFGARASRWSRCENQRRLWRIRYSMVLVHSPTKTGGIFLNIF